MQKRRIDDQTLRVPQSHRQTVAFAHSHDQFFRVSLNADIIGIAMAMILPYGQAIQDCQSSSGSNGDLSKDGDAIAERMVSSGRTMIELAIGSRLGEMAGWPARRLADLKRERAALTMVAFGGTRDFTAPQSCHDAITGMERAKRQSAIGEVAVLRAELESSGLSAEDLEVQYDQWNANIQNVSGRHAR